MPTEQHKAVTSSNSISTGSFQSGPTQTNLSARSPAQPAAAAARLATGIPSNITQVEGLSISQALVNDVIVDLQTKVINESHQQFLSDSSASQYLGSIVSFAFVDRFQRTRDCLFFIRTRKLPFRTVATDSYSSTESNNNSSFGFESFTR